MCELQHQIQRDIKIIDLKASSLWFSVTPIIKLLNATKYDIAFSTCGGMSIPLVIAGKISSFKGKLIVSERNTLFRTYSSNFKKFALLKLKDILYKHADVVTTVSLGLKREVVDKFDLSEEKVKVVDNPLIDSEMRMLSDESIASKYAKKIMILAVGRFVKQKDYPTMFKAFAEVLKVHKNACLVILGKGPLMNDIKNLALRMNLQDSIDFLGFDPNPYKYMAKCDIFLLTSLHEGMPGVLIQAMALGAVSVATDCPTGPNEIITNKQNGYLVEVGNYRQVAETIIDILNSSERNVVSALAIESVSRYSVTNGVKSYFNAIN